MLLRSSSNPSLNSLIFNHLPSPDINHNNNHFFMKKSPSFSLLLTKTSSETDLTTHISRRRSLSCTRSSFLDVVEDVVGEEICSVGGGGGDGDGRMCGGYGGGKGGDHGEGNDGTADLYYKTMIDANPGNSLILGNYAKYLKEVRGDLEKAEEFYSRAILANPSDGYRFKASPDDCYVMDYYARFLWDADEEDEEEVSSMNIAPPSFLHESSQQFPVAAT
nr:hypothetical protein [Tanacetum cinerariifolium]